MEGRLVTLRIKRYDPEKDREPYFKDYQVPYRDDMVVLDALNYIKDKVDGSLTFRWSCRMGVCGSCGALVNGRPVLTCATYIKDVRRRVITIEPLCYFPIIKDLVVDIEDVMTKLARIKPYIIRRYEKPISEGEYLQSPDEMELYHQTSLCINCMLCYSACPIYGLDKEFLGPAVLALTYRYMADSRDQGKDERLEKIMSREGIWGCHFVGDCSAVCPKGVDPGSAIQTLKAMGSVQLMKLLLPGIRR